MRSMFRSMLVALVAVVALGTVASASASAHEWLKDGVPLTKTEEISIEGGRKIFTAAGKEIACEKTQGTGDVYPGAGGEVNIHFSECKTSISTCAVHSHGEPNGSISFDNIPTTLLAAKTSGGAELLGDELRQNPTTKEFGLLEFEAQSSKACEEYPTAKVKGDIIAEVINAPEGLNFPNPELQGDTFSEFGIAADWFGSYQQRLTAGGKLVGV